MMGRKQAGRAPLFYAFNLEDHAPANHLLRGIDQFLDLSKLHQHLTPHYSHTGRPSIDPALMLRMLIIGYRFGIRSERRLCEEVHLNLAYRWFCRLGLEDSITDHSTFSKNRHGRFRDNDTLRFVFEKVLQRSKNISLTDPASQWTVVPGVPAFYAYSTNYLIDVAAGIIVDVEASPARCTDEVNATRTMVEQVEDRFDLKPMRLIGDTAYSSVEMLGWMIDDKSIEPHVPVWDKSERSDDTFSRSDFTWSEEDNEYR